MLSPNRALDELGPHPLRRRKSGRGSIMFWTSKARKKSSSSPYDSQEPSSPKVTCIGQVRVKKKDHHHHHQRETSLGPRRTGPINIKDKYRNKDDIRNRCRHSCCFPISLCDCLVFHHVPKNSPPIPIAIHGSGKRNSGRKWESGNAAAAVAASEHEPPPPPPRNALVLMRCRSEPLRTLPSLANSPTSEEQQGKDCSSSGVEFGGYNSESPEEVQKSLKSDWEKGERRIMLTRCKSEPARRCCPRVVVGPDEACFWKATRFGLGDDERSPWIFFF
ncbi:hypothetical protein AMTRI_Chr08g164120 [Amborella trichopoda]|uniref:Uncharacterized protein n=1 Tax=Amborella trichopoda TaxID=13333 RepID=W1PWG5_AMBTC|nr:uncharacterized protein LOC18440403 [Amborella trichopoda]ERN12194.1 hypothetical protein AMTR_s00034p00145870 [Amborella trichopoda]|eukprot:XP_006850613.1 uncharacterized protein LOC18440403 [Amborella trichopoda]